MLRRCGPLLLLVACGVEQKLAVNEQALVDRHQSRWDYDADGYADMLVGANGAGDFLRTGFTADVGRAYMIKGSASGPVLTDTIGPGPIRQLEHGDNFGLSIAVGHFSQDERGDFVIGAPGRSGPEGRHEGRVYTFRGEDRDLSAYQELKPIAERQQDQLFGAAVALGDFDGDGRDDVAVGAPGDATDARTVSAAGTVHLFRSTTRGHVPAWIWTRSILDQTGDIPQSGNNFGDKFGHALAAGDFDCDGFEDLAVGVPGFNNDAGRVIIFRGSSAGLRPSKVLTSADFSIPPNRSDYFGLALAVGDLWGTDNCRDLAVAAPNMGQRGPRRGAVFIYRRDRLQGLTAHQEIEMDSMVDPFDGANFGASMAFGDMDGDGDEDLIIGAPGYEDHGAAFYYLSEEVSEQGTATKKLQDRLRLEKSDFHETPAEGDVFGAAVAAADFDNDGRAHFAVGAPGDFQGAVSAGRVFFYRSYQLPGILNPDGWTRSSQGIDGERFGGSMMGSGRYMRRVVIEEDYLPGCIIDGFDQLADPWVPNQNIGRTFSMENMFYAGGILADRWVDGAADSPFPAGWLSSAQFHEVMDRSRNPSLLSAGDRWSTYLLFLSQICIDQPWGQMFDSDFGDINGIPREGAWVATGLLQATHEIGHTFNLHHDEWDTIPKTPGDDWSCPDPLECQSIMHPSSRGDFFFSKKSKTHLMNHPDRYVRPGWVRGAAFAEDACIPRHINLH